MPHNASLDLPIEQHDDDCFNRWQFSQRLAETIVGFDTSSGAPVIGLYGKWGYGKSTVLNFIIEELQANYTTKATVLAFNPWLFNDSDKLLFAFFAALAKTIEASLSKEGKRIGEILANYSGALTAIPLVGSGLAAVAKAAGNDLSSGRTAEEQRTFLIDLMKKYDRKVIVLIDDLDRLDPAEVMTMLKLVRLSANFPNIVYLLAFDDDRVANIAGQTYGDRTYGRQFLEKIIQYPFSLPLVPRHRLAKFVLDQARAACKAAEVELNANDWAIFDNLCQGTLLMRLTTPRQAVRYANALRFALPLLAGEVDPLNQMVVEAMRVLFPDLYSWARQHPEYLPSNSSSREYDRQEFYRSAKGAVGREEESAVESLLDALTVRLSKPVFGKLRYHERYFSYAVPSDDISDRSMNRLIHSLESGDQKLTEVELARLLPERPEALLDCLLEADRDIFGTVRGKNSAQQLLLALAAIHPTLDKALANRVRDAIINVLQLGGRFDHSGMEKAVADVSLMPDVLRRIASNAKYYGT